MIDLANSGLEKSIEELAAEFGQETAEAIQAARADEAAALEAADREDYPGVLHALGQAMACEVRHEGSSGSYEPLINELKGLGLFDTDSTAPAQAH